MIGDRTPRSTPSGPADTPSALRTWGLTKRFGDLTAVDELDLEVRVGEVFGFLGPNGAGKSTTIRLLMDELRPTAGRAELLGMDHHVDAQTIHAQVGYLPGDLALYPSLTGWDTIRFFGNLRGGVDEAHVRTLAERLDADLDRRVGELSSGNRQKVGLIQAFMHRPQLLIMDEPTSGLDPLVQREFQVMVGEAVARGGTVFLSSHTLSEVQRVADRVGIIRDGRLVDVEGVEALRTRAVRRVELTFARPVDHTPLSLVPGVREIHARGRSVTLSLDGPMAGLLAAVSRCGELLDLATHEADLEEVFLTFYRDSPGDPHRGGGGAVDLTEQVEVR